ncbi:MAG: class I SAM-dependent methyltransferase, partial [Candidatus Pacebacteria bacterium]|nr:class I SAM-dependent methyltransferase [Candidatus Paceibacterota bacterium]
SFFPVIQEIADKIKNGEKSFKNKKFALDLGAGNGWASFILLKNGFITDTIDKDSFKIAHMNEHLKHWEKKFSGKTNIIKADIVGYPLPINHYQLVIVLNLFHLLSEDEQKIVADKILKSLKRGGYLIASILTPDSPKKPEKFNSGLKLEDFKKLFKKLKIVSAETFLSDRGQHINLLTAFKPLGFWQRLLQRFLYN